MYREIEDKVLADKFANTDFFKSLKCDDNYLEIIVKETKDSHTFFCNFYEYNRHSSTIDFSKEIEDFINIVKDNKEKLLNKIGPFEDNDNLEVIINCSEHFEGSTGIVIVII